jgi:NADP-dependent 3-hydroxy acid dehydrogenase YdfG
MFLLGLTTPTTHPCSHPWEGVWRGSWQWGGGRVGWGVERKHILEVSKATIVLSKITVFFGVSLGWVTLHPRWSVCRVRARPAEAWTRVAPAARVPMSNLWGKKKSISTPQPATPDGESAGETLAADGGSFKEGVPAQAGAVQGIAGAPNASDAGAAPAAQPVSLLAGANIPKPAVQQAVGTSLPVQAMQQQQPQQPQQQQQQGEAGGGGTPAPAPMGKLPAPTQPARKNGLAEDFKLRIPSGLLAKRDPEAALPVDVQLAPAVRIGGVACVTLWSWLGHAFVALRLLLALPIGIALAAALVLLVLILVLQLIYLLPLAVLLGVLLPAEREAAAPVMALPAQHVVVLGGGAGLTRAVALECVRRGADVTVLAAESADLTQTYELMKTTSLERQAHVKQQLRCSPLDLSDGPMACFVALQNVIELVGRIDCFICHPAELILEGKGGGGVNGAEPARSRLTQKDISESVLCCVWAVRAIMFPMQRQENGRVLVLGSAPSNAVTLEKVQYKLAMQALGRSLRSEVCTPPHTRRASRLCASFAHAAHASAVHHRPAPSLLLMAPPSHVPSRTSPPAPPSLASLRYP